MVRQRFVCLFQEDSLKSYGRIKNIYGYRELDKLKFNSKLKTNIPGKISLMLEVLRKKAKFW